MKKINEHLLRHIENQEEGYLRVLLLSVLLFFLSPLLVSFWGVSLTHTLILGYIIYQKKGKNTPSSKIRMILSRR